jgi:hypothetical protein
MCFVLGMEKPGNKVLVASRCAADGMIAHTDVLRWERAAEAGRKWRVGWDRPNDD